MKRIITIFLAVLLLLSFSMTAFAYQIIGLENFQRELAYTDDVFTDNLTTDWFYDNVASVYEYSLMQGIGNNQFNPSGNVTIAAAITVAVRISCIYNDGGLPEFETDAGDEWYEPYVQSALRRGIIQQGFPNYNAPATRAEFSKLLAASINNVDLEEINTVDDGAIPDVAMDSDYAEAVYLLYRAGVLTGSDTNGTFNPDSTISRAAAAAIITRIVDPSLRKTIELIGEY